MQRLILTIIAAFVMAIVFGPVVIPWLRRMKFGQTIYDLGPQSHKKKQGIPTMGGVIFALPALIAALAFAQNDTRWDFLLIAVVCAVGFGLVGFVDDFIKVKLHRSLGLTPKQKLAPQAVIALGLSIWAYKHPLIGSKLIVPFVNVEWDLGWFYIPVMMFILVGTVNSANLLDGLDGLLGGCSLFDFATMALICVLMAGADAANSSNFINTAIFAGAMAGGLLGFLRFNACPAERLHGRRRLVLHRRRAGGHLSGDAPFAAVAAHRLRDVRLQPLGHHPGDLLQGHARQARVPHGAAAPSL